MEKDALLEIIIHEVKEVERLIETFKGKPTLSAAFFKLARNKANNILEEIDLLEQLAEETPAQAPQRIKNPPLREEIVTRPEPETAVPPTPVPPTEETPTEEKSIEVIMESEPTPDVSVPEPAPVIEAPLPPTTSPKAGNTVLGEALMKNKSSFNDQIGQKGANGATRRLLTAAPVSDLRKALGINDRFLFQRELFGGNSDLLNQTLDQLNQMQSFEDARSFLTTNFNWTSDNEAVTDFWELVERRFI
jgi:hypothetical protein